MRQLSCAAGWNLHKAEDIGIDDFQAKRAPDDRYRTTPLRALWDTKQIHKGGFYHDEHLSPALPDGTVQQTGQGAEAPGTAAFRPVAWRDAGLAARARNPSASNVSFGSP